MRAAKRAAWIAVGLALTLPAATAIAVALTPLPPELRDRGSTSVRITDRDGHLLREVRTDDGARARWIALADYGTLVERAVVDAEDHRFYHHFGVDVVALARAAWTDLRARRAVSGGSTLTMQLARAVRPHRRSLAGKVAEILLALRIESSLSKAAILEQYLNRVTLGPNVRGFAAASHAYFGKPPSSLSPAQAALLAGLARGPSYYDVMRHPNRALARRDRLLQRMFDAGDLAFDTLQRGLTEPLALQHVAAAFGAPHFVRALARGSLTGEQSGLADALRMPHGEVQSTIDSTLQREAEAGAARVPSDFAAHHATAASAVIVDNATGDVLAYVGSPDYFDDAHGGQNDGVRARRQPGSTLKPFLYAMAIERLGWTAATVLPDVELHVSTPAGDYAPRDYDDHTRGPARLREALGNSLNIPAVWAAQQIGTAAFLERLHALGFASLDRDPDYYGPALALGDGEVSLLELVSAYATLARGGVARPLRFVRSIRDGGEREVDLPVEDPVRIVPENVAAQVIDILRDPEARRAAFGADSVLDFDFDVAAKTGTSKGYRDNWAVGFTQEVTVGVWVGNFDGSPMSGTSGITGAGPLFHTLMGAAMRNRPARSLGIDAGTAIDLGLKRVEICALSGERPGPSCAHRLQEWMTESAAASLPPCSFHERVVIDRRNGLRAGPACGESDVVERDYERYPPEFAAWARSTGRATAPVQSSPLCPTVDPAPSSDGDDRSLRIVSPRDDARFAVDPDRRRELQSLDVEVAAPRGTAAVRLRVDGTVLGDRGPPYTFAWPLQEGDHVFVAEAQGLRESEPLRIHVRGL